SAKIRSRSIFNSPEYYARRASGSVLDLCLWAVGAASGLCMPAAFVILVLDRLRVARNGLLRSGPLRCGKRCRVRRVRFRKHAADLVAPTPFVLDNLICDFAHRRDR